MTNNAVFYSRGNTWVNGDALVARAGTWVAGSVVNYARSGTWVPVTSTYVRPSGPGITPVEGLSQQYPGVVYNTFVNQIASGQQLSFPSANYVANDFAISSSYVVLAWLNVLGLLGSGKTLTSLSIAAGSSTKANTIPAQSTGSTNQLTVLRMGTDKPADLRTVKLTGYTVFGTPQPNDPNTGAPHGYNLVQFFEATNSGIEDCLLRTWYGSAAANPGETFGFNDFRGTNNYMLRTEVDGRDPSGVRVGASAIGLNNGTGFTATDVWAHGVRYGAGITAFGMVGNLTYTRFKSTDNVIPFNFEHNGATTTVIEIADPISTGNRSTPTSGSFVTKPIFAVIDSDVGSCVLNIRRATLDSGVPSPTNPVIIVRHGTYAGVTNRQLASDFHYFDINGVEQPTYINVATNETLPSPATLSLANLSIALKAKASLDPRTASISLKIDDEKRIVYSLSEPMELEDGQEFSYVWTHFSEAHPQLWPCDENGVGITQHPLNQPRVSCSDAEALAGFGYEVGETE